MLPYRIIRDFFLIFFILFNLPLSVFAQFPGPGNALLFNGTGNYINAGVNNRGITNKITVEAWVKTSSFNYEWIVGKYSNSLGEESGYHLFINNGKASFNGRDGSNTYYSAGMSSTTIADGKWHHLTGIYNLGQWQIWVDGILENQVISGFVNGNLATIHPPLTIGNYYEFSSQNFTGQLDEIRIWKTVRTQDQIRAHMCQKLGAQQTDLVAHYTFDQATGNILIDHSVNPIPGNLMNFSGSSHWVRSGAPIGDKSVFTYTPGSGSLKFTQTPSGHSFEVNKFPATTIGAHLYLVNAAPVEKNGLGPGNNSNHYYGVFTLAAPANTYEVTYTFPGGCNQLFSREDNAATTWELLNTLNYAPNGSLVKNAEKYRGEYILAAGSNLTVNISGQAQLCETNKAQLTASSNTPNVSFLWNTGARTSSIEVNQPGKYFVTATAPNGCLNSDTLIIQKLSPPALAILGPQVICENSEITLSASTGTEFLWNTGAKTKDIRVNKPGNYSLKIQDANGCTAETAITINLAQGLNNFSLGRDTSLCAGSILTLGKYINGASYKWQDGSTAALYPVKEAGTYTVEVTVNNCITRRSIQVAMKTCIPFIPNIITPNQDGVNDCFVIKDMNTDDWQLQIFNRWGNLIFESPRYDNTWNAKNCADGVYYYKLAHNRTKQTYQGYLEVMR